uniref:Uncharacterized protein n=1 Tax=Sphaerodactylus townsendi TaxID=933632 RepID=A0ACB8EHN9_9SAUR
MGQLRQKVTMSPQVLWKCCDCNWNTWLAALGLAHLSMDFLYLINSQFCKNAIMFLKGARRGICQHQGNSAILFPTVKPSIKISIPLFPLLFTELYGKTDG